MWDGNKVHLTETCEPDTLNLITNVVTTVATVPDISMTDAMHAQLAEAGRLSGKHRQPTDCREQRLHLR